MKKILFKISLFTAIVVLAAGSARAQLPLLQGDAVITHSPHNNTAPVVRIVHTNNTSTAPLGQNWNTAGMSPPGTKPDNNYYGNWMQASLGDVFGITLDQNAPPNIYVSSTQIYSSSTTYNRTVWRLNATTGANQLVFNFNTISTNNSRSLGNLKYAAFGTTENLYISDWGDGVIRRLTTANSSSTTPSWSPQTSFVPKFGKTQHDAAEMPYGLAIRNMPSGGRRLYYAKISTNSNGNTIGGYGNNEIWSVGLNNTNGDFLADEVQENIGFSMNRPVATDAAHTYYRLPVIADIAFTADGKQMLIGQQTWNGFGKIAPHNSKVWEFKIDNSNVWQPSIDLFPAGQGAGTNAVGGVSYSNNILKAAENALACDTTAWFTADAIRYDPTYTLPQIYGLQGMNANGGSALGSFSPNSYPGSIWIDEDEITNVLDKTFLGDIEVYKKPLNCGPVCSCGSWNGPPTLNGDPIAAVPIDIHIDGASTANDGGLKKTLPTGPVGTPVLLVNYPIQFVQGNVTGLINSSYQCSGGCSGGASFTWSIFNSTNTAILIGTSLPVDISHYNTQLQCGNYKLVIKARCGDSNCGSQTIPITIICEPPVDCCKASIDIDLKTTTVHAVTNLPDPTAFSTANFVYNMQFSLPMSEVRVSVEEFRLSSTSPNCLNCSNRPVTWGNIIGADINGTALALTGAGGIPTGSVQADYREAVYSGTPLMPSAAALHIRLSLPAVTDLSCCEVYAYVCLKFTFKDTQCRECVQMVCGKILLAAPKDPGGPRTDKIEVKKFKVQH